MCLEEHHHHLAPILHEGEQQKTMNNSMTRKSHKFWKEVFMLKSFPTVNQAVNAIKQLEELCSRVGFNLTKFISNKEEVINSIPDDKRKSIVRNGLVTLGNLPEEKALGVKWDTQNDTLGFYIKSADEPLTRHDLLSTLSSVYDPLGLGVPFLLKGRHHPTVLQKQVELGRTNR